jgi:uncharacterized phage protein (TIGR01671 family)
MMDRFKFRLWDKDIGNYFEKPYIFINTDGLLVSDDCVHVYEIDQKAYIVESCTGLKDKNGKLIYEGDIIREISKKEPEWEEYVTEVKWKVCGFNIYDAADFYFEVIGNIHENKELLDE